MKKSAQAAMLGSESIALSNSACKGKVITSILQEERTTPELRRSSSHFVDVFCWAIVGRDARQWPDLPHAKHVPGLGRGKNPGTSAGRGRSWLYLVDSAGAEDFFFFNAMT